MSADLGDDRAASPQVRILFLATSPEDQPSLRWGEEWREIQDQLGRRAESFEVELRPAVRYRDVEERLRNFQPQLAHFSGHGNVQGELLLQDEQGFAQPVSVEALGKLFEILRRNLRCVVLSACYSEKQALAIAEAIDCVVGVPKPIDDQAATAFASSFYGALAAGANVQEMFELGCNRLRAELLHGPAMPQLFCRPGVNASEVVLLQSHPGNEPIKSVREAPLERSLEGVTMRDVLYEALCRLPEGMFSSVLFRLNVPVHSVFADSATRAEKAGATIRWSELIDEKLRKLQAAVEKEQPGLVARIRKELSENP